MKTTQYNKGAYFPLQYASGYQPETIDAMDTLEKQCAGTVSFQAATFGMKHAEPLLLMIDSAIRYAKAFEQAFDRKMGDDYMAKPEISSILSGIRGLLNFNGGCAMEQSVSTDSKDNGMIESLFWTACEIAGIDGEEICSH